jgi:flavin reductase (DIM6/NTAB) family NADH-FMN oxidoreductase RutF
MDRLPTDRLTPKARNTTQMPDTAANIRKSAGSAPFKLGMRMLAGAVSVVTAHTSSGEPIGLTATSVSSLSAEPPSLLVCVNRKTEIAGVLTPGAAFAVNVLTTSQIDVAQAFGGQTSAKGRDRFSAGTWHRSPDGEVPLLIGCRAAFECTVVHVQDWETHHIVIGSVTEVHFFNSQEPPLAYCDGAYQTLKPI